ncbi:hypothetical protein HNQ56_001779 [Anaerotaenia torta]|uniref:DUF4430 domain-containing protein n=1 Tax=Anaerotaenia torta TaxID=433293 RepID=UPI003D1C72E1
MKQSNTIKRVIISCLAMVLVILAMVLIYNRFKPEPQKGAKEIAIEVIIPEEEAQKFTLHTDAEYLRQALEEKDLIQGSDSEYGLFITEVNGRSADSAKQEWWCITKDGASVEYGVDSIAIADGDKYEITLTVGY